jgi:hypothetical protein
MSTTPDPREDDTAERLRAYAAQGSAAFEQAIKSAPLLDRVPGRSVTLVGTGLVALAIGLSMLPMFSGVGMMWSTLMLLGAAIVSITELESAGGSSPVRAPTGLRHPLIAPAYAAVVMLHAFLLLQVAIVPLLWACAAVLLAWDQYRRAARAHDGFVHQFDLRHAWRGYRRNVTAGVGLCLVSMFMTWGSSSGYWSGGMSYNYAYRTDGAGNYGYGYAYDYTPMQYYWPGWETSGRNQSFAMLAVALLLGLVLWAAYSRPTAAGRDARIGGVAAGSLLTLFWLLAAKDGAGSALFLVGLATILFAAHRIWRGEEEGRWDLATLTARYRRR